MATACGNTEWFSGQGALLAAERDGSGNPTGFRWLGDVEALTLSNEVEKVEKQESCSGARTTAKTLIQSISANVAFTMNSFSKENLAVTTFGTASDIASAVVTTEATTGYHDKWTPLAHIGITTWTSLTDVGAATTYVEGTDYDVNLSAGSYIVYSTGAITNAQALEANYTYADYENVEAFTTSVAPLRWLRFEGLNTAATNEPVVVDVYKFEFSPLAELALINEEFSSIEVEGEALSDGFRTTGSKFYTVKKQFFVA